MSRFILNLFSLRLRSALLVAFTCLTCGVYYGAAQATGETSKPSYTDLERAAKQADGLHKAAMLNNGIYIQHMTAMPWNQSASLDSLTQNSDAIAVGTVQSAGSELINNGKGIVTHYTLQVQQVLKGATQPGGSVDVVLVGGKITFGDGTVAVVEAAKEPVLLQGHSYVVFGKSVSEGKSFRPLGGAQGVFEIDQSARWVHPHATDAADPLRSYSKLTPDKFIDQVQTLVRQQGNKPQE
jgi:hypothetical protein